MFCGETYVIMFLQIRPVSVGNSCTRCIEMMTSILALPIAKRHAALKTRIKELFDSLLILVYVYDGISTFQRQ